MKKLPERVRVSLLGCGLMLPLLVVCALTPAVSFFWQTSPLEPLGFCALFRAPDCAPIYSADDGLMVQVWWRDAVQTVQQTDWGLALLNTSKAVLVVGAVVAAGIGLLLFLSGSLADGDSKNAVDARRIVATMEAAQDADSTGSEEDY